MGEVRFLGDVENSPLPIERTIKRLAGRYDRLHVCFEAGPTGYGLYRKIQALGHECMVVAPALIPKRSGERIKTNRRDAVTLARLHRAGELTGVWTPDAGHEAVRDLVRAREAATDDLRSQAPAVGFLSAAAQPDLQRRRPLDDGASALAGQPEVRTCRAADRLSGRDRRDRRCGSTPASPRETTRSHRAGAADGAGVAAYQAMRGASLLVSVTFAAEIGDVRRFDTPRQLMSFLGLVPAESPTGDTVRRNGLTLAGNRRARQALVEAAWTYRYPASVSEPLRARLEALPKPVRDIAWKAQIRLCASYRRLSATGKKLPVVVAAVAREMAAFLWAIGREVAPA
jgi:transposase